MRAASLIESIFKLQESIFIKIACLSRIPNLSVNLSIIYIYNNERNYSSHKFEDLSGNNSNTILQIRHLEEEMYNS